MLRIVCQTYWSFSWGKYVYIFMHFLDEIGKNIFLKNSSFLVRVAIYFLVPIEEFKTEKIILPTVECVG